MLYQGISYTSDAGWGGETYGWTPHTLFYVKRGSTCVYDFPHKARFNSNPGLFVGSGASCKGRIHCVHAHTFLYEANMGL